MFMRPAVYLSGLLENIFGLDVGTEGTRTKYRIPAVNAVRMVVNVKNVDRP